MVFLLLACAALVVVLAASIRRDPRWSGNAFLLTTAATGVLFALAVGGGGLGIGALVGGMLLLLVVLSPLLLAVLVLFLVTNGIRMLRRRGRRLLHVLSLLIGVAVLVIGVAGIAGIITAHGGSWRLSALLFVFLLCCWAAFILVSFLVYTIVYPQFTVRTAADYVMVHGCRLASGEAPPMLRGRVDAGIAHWRRCRAVHPEAPLILSGWRAPGTPRSEAAAMAEYARSVGVPEDAIWIEDRSPTTEANLLCTQRMVADRLPAGARGLTVTSDFHVVRTAALARRTGVDAVVAPSRTAPAAFPSNFLREVVIMLNWHKLAYSVATAIICLPLPVLMAVVVAGQG